MSIVGILSMLIVLAVQPTTIAPATPAAVEVSVVEAETGRPIAGARVKLGVALEEYPETVYVADAAGRLMLPVPAEPTSFVHVQVRAPGRVAMMSEWRSDVIVGGVRLPPRIEFRMPRGTRVGGVVRRDDGLPAAGARLELFVEPVGGVPTSGGEPVPYCWRIAISADQQGRWTSDEVPAGWGRFSVVLQHPEYVNTKFLIPVEPPAALLAGTAEVTMTVGRRLTGRVVDESGRPIAGAEVQQTTSGMGDENEPVRTDDEGRFSFEHVATTPVDVLATMEGCAPAIAQLPRDTADAEMTLTIEPARPVIVRLRRPDGTPARGAVRVDTIGGVRFPFYDRVQRTDADGAVSVVLPRTEATLTTWSVGHITRHVTVSPDDEAVTVDFIPQTPVYVTAVDARTGAPVVPDRVVIAARPKGERLRRTTVAALTERGHAAALWVEADDVAARVEAPGYAVANVSTSDPAPGVAMTLQASLVPAEPIVGTVLDPHGNPAVGADVVALAGTGIRISGLVAEGGFDGHTAAVTDAAGAFRLARPEDAGDLLVLSTAGFARVPVGELQSPVTLSPWRGFEAMTRKGGEAVVGQSVRFRSEFAGPGGTVMFESYATADSTGVARSKPALPNTTVANVPLSSSQRAGSLNRFVRAPDVPDSSAARLDVHFDASASGWGLPPAGLPEGWTWDYATLCQPAGASALESPAPTVGPYDYPSDIWPTQYVVKVKEDGSFEVPAVESGRYLLTVNAGLPGNGWACTVGLPVARYQAWVEIKPGANQLAQLALERLPAIEVGDAAAPLAPAAFDGRPLDLSGLNGKYVVIDFWATWCAPCRAEIPHLKALRDRYANDDRLAILSLSLDDTVPDAAAFVEREETNGPRWLHGHLGRVHPALEAYGVRSIPSMWLIGPDGRVIAKDLRGEGLAAAVDTALGGPRGRKGDS